MSKIYCTTSISGQFSSPTTIAFDGEPAFADNQVKQAIKKGRVISSPSIVKSRK